MRDLCVLSCVSMWRARAACCCTQATAHWALWALIDGDRSKKNIDSILYLLTVTHTPPHSAMPVMHQTAIHQYDNKRHPHQYVTGHPTSTHQQVAAAPPQLRSAHGPPTLRGSLTRHGRALNPSTTSLALARFFLPSFSLSYHFAFAAAAAAAAGAPRTARTLEGDDSTARPHRKSRFILIVS